MNKARLVTPVPGGVGPLTVSMLIKNVIKSWARTNKIPFSLDDPVSSSESTTEKN